MRRNDSMPYPPKEYYPLDPSIKELLRATETKEEVDAYFEHIYHCICKEICADCGHAIKFEEHEYRSEHIKEYNISGLCKSCQEETFGK